MPHIVVTVLQGIPVEKKKGMAKDITTAVANNFGLPPEMVAKELEYMEIPLENFAPAAELAAENLPPPIKYVSIHCLEGRTLQQKREMAKDVTEAVARHLGIPPESQEIAVEIVEVSPENIAHGGKLSLDSPPPVSK